MYEFNLMGQEKEPTQDEINQGFLHHLLTLLNLHGAGKHLVNRLRDIENRPIEIEDVYFVMNAGCNQIEKLKGVLSGCPTIKVEKSDSKEDQE